MAYPDPLDPAVPAGPDKRKFGDDAIRQHVRAIRQRLASIFVDVDADPLVLKPLTVNSGMLVDLAILTAKIADLAVTTAKLADGSVTAAKLAALAVGTANIIDAAVTQAKLANLSVGTAQIIDAAVTAAKLAALSVATGSLIDASVTTAKLADLSVSTGKLIDASVTLAKIDPAVFAKTVIAHGGWFVDNVPGTSASFMERFRAGGGLDQHVVVMTQAGEIRGVWVRGNANKTGGNVQFLVSINGVSSGAFAQIGDAPYGVREDYRLYAAGVAPFAAGDYLGINWSSVGLVPAGTTEYVAGFEVRYT